MTCVELSVVASELALELLSAEERAAALAHLEVCSPCRHDVARLTDAVEEFLLLAPDVEPSAGFERRTLTRIDALAVSGVPKREQATKRRRLTPWRALAAAAVLVVIVATTAFVVLRPDSGERALRMADMRTGAGQIVGSASLAADPASVVLTIPNWVGLVEMYGSTVDAPYWLAVEERDGSQDLERLPRADAQPWTVTLDEDPNAVIAVSVVDNTGTVWCTARFGAAT